MRAARRRRPHCRARVAAGARVTSSPRPSAHRATSLATFAPHPPHTLIANGGTHEPRVKMADYTFTRGASYHVESFYFRRGRGKTWKVHWHV